MTTGLSQAKKTLLEQRVRGTARTRHQVIPPVTRREGGGPAPLSLAQEQLWYFSQLAPENPVYNETASIRKDGPLDLTALRWAFNELVRRQDIWRTTFELRDGVPVQVVHAPSVFELPLIDVSNLPAAEREDAAARRVAEEARRPYQLTMGPLIRPMLLRFSAQHHRLYLAMHHLIFDGVSLYRIVLPELIALYDAARAGRPSPLAEPVIQYADYSAWQHQQADSDEMGRRLAYWRSRLDGASKLELPLDHARPPKQRFRGRMETLYLPKALVHALREVAREAGCTLFQLVAAAFGVLLQRYTGQEDLVFGTMADLREKPELEAMLGYCVTPLVLRLDLSDDPIFHEALHRARAEVLGALANVVPFERVVREVQPKRDLSINPIFQAMVVMEPPTVAADPSWSLHLMEVAIGNLVGNAKLDLHIELDERPEGHISGRLIYNRDVFEASTAHRIGTHLVRLLDSIAAAPTARISDLPLMNEEEVSQQLVAWNATDAEYPQDTPLHVLIQAQVARTPDAVAVQCAGKRLTYAELDRRSDRVALLLGAAGVKRGDLVAICVPRSLHMLVGMLGILKAGAAYVPLDPSYPSERLAFMVQDSRAKVVVTEAGLPPGLSGLDVAAIQIADIDGSDAIADTVPDSGVTAEDVAYVIYTSGSTGVPKGVRIPHRCVVNLVSSMAREPGMTPDDRVLAITTYSFDIAVVELWLPLVCGARIELAPTEVAADGRLLARLSEETRPTFIQATPASWRALLESGWPGDPKLTALAGGEAVSPELADQILSRCARLWNVYGPTETTVWSTLGPIRQGERITIGRPLANTSVYILDRHRRPQPVGVPGEIFIGGAGVALGYLNRPELTAERFVQDPFRPGATMYATGDLGRFREDGRIEHLGRLDAQVKVRGYRIETGEVESALARDPRVAAAAVVARADLHGEKELVAYVVAANGAPVEPASLRTLLRRSLPDYMVPSRFVRLEALPLTPNGKVNRKALPEPDRDSRAAAGAYIEPTTPLEKQLAAIWANVFGVERVGIEDNFFDLGGHSLLALRLLSEIRRVLDAEVPVSVFFQGAATIVGLAKAIGDSRAPSGPSLLVKVQPNGSLPALFFVHSHETSLLTLRHFTGPLGPNQPVTALLPQRRDGRFDRTSSVVLMATGLVAAIRTEQEHGPYYIAGHSFGGLLAYEIATQLRAAGEQVGWLGILDAGTPDEAGRWLRARLNKKARFGRLLKLGFRGAPAKVLEVAQRESNEILVGIGKKLDPLGDAKYDWEGAIALVVRYKPSGTDAPLELFTPSEELMFTGSRFRGWREVHRGPITVHEVHGDHLSMLTEPNVDVLAELVAVSLRAARARQPLAARR